MILFIIITFICIFYLLSDLVPIYQQKQWKLLWTYSAMMTFVYILTLLLDLGVKIPSPAVPLEKIVSLIFGV